MPNRARGLPPVHLWNPPCCGDIGLRIARDGTWYSQGSPIGRAQLVRVFASILRKNVDQYVLVTPHEMVTVTVEDAPFLAVELELLTNPEGRSLRLRTNVDDVLVVGPNHPMRFEQDEAGGFRPYIRVRGDLWARATRAVYYELMDLVEVRRHGETDSIGIVSAGLFFPMAPASTVELTS